ncbi:hypothetical protein GCM10009839_88470 [Catenulispora yoronensis]|uniref:Protein-glutamine gamma-glutamyltransferase-like C-terminal domain-containing protein n=1 Tax=Catenulispora yoronensis TaxID=450799 RepID=A0ABP5H510_9ACTN
MTDPGLPVAPTPGVPIVVGRDEARRAAADELAKPGYAHARPGLAQRVLGWIGHELKIVWNKVFGGSGGGGDDWVALLTVLAVLIVLVVVIRARYGPVRRRVAAERALFDEETPLDAEGYRRAAEEHAVGGRWAEAVRARLRAVIAGLEERTVLDPRPGRTADVAARQAGQVLPEQAEALAGAARVFDDIWYGEAAAGPEDYRRLVAVDEAVQGSRVRLGAGKAAAEKVGAGVGGGTGSSGGASNGGVPGIGGGAGPEAGTGGRPDDGPGPR